MTFNLLKFKRKQHKQVKQNFYVYGFGWIGATKIYDVQILNFLLRITF